MGNSTSFCQDALYWYRESLGELFGSELFGSELFGNELFDNEKWVDKNLVGRFDRGDVDTVFAFVKRTHPMFGCVSMRFPLSDVYVRKNRSTITLQETARFADAVVVFCFEALGKDPEQLPSDDIIATTTADLKVMSLASCAYIALHHSDPIVRGKYERAFHLVATMI